MKSNKIKLELDVWHLSASDCAAISASLGVVLYRMAIRIETLERHSAGKEGREKLKYRLRIAAIRDLRVQLSSAVSQLSSAKDKG